MRGLNLLMPARAHINSVFTGWFFIEDFCLHLRLGPLPFEGEIELASFHRLDYHKRVDFTLFKKFWPRF